MAQFEKPNGGSAGAGNRETLAKIARLISVTGESELADATPGGGERTRQDNARDEPLSLASLNQPGTTRLLEAIPAGLAVCLSANMIKANAAFALAFGYHTAQELEDAGGLSTVFPAESKALAKHLGKSPTEPVKQIRLQARSRSGREFSMPVAVHAIAAEGDEKASLLVLHPQPGKGHKPGASAERASPPEAVSEARPKPAADLPDAKLKQRDKRRKNKNKSKKGTIVHINKTDFLAKVSHEVRTPLNSIIGFAELMKEEQLGPIGNERYRGYIRDIYDSGLYALSLVNDLLDISKIESGEFEMNFAAVDLNEVVGESVHSMQPQAQRQRVLLRTSCADDLPPVLADRRSIKQIILNLVSNAIKFTKPGGQVIVQTRRTSSGGVKIRVRDTGIGMSEGEITVALKPFQQVDTAPRKQKGTGLGLPLTKALVEANRAKFKLRSVPNAGTRIDVTFAERRVAKAKE